MENKLAMDIYNFGKEKNTYIGTAIGLFSGIMIGYSIQKINFDWIKKKFNK